MVIKAVKYADPPAGAQTPDPQFEAQVRQQVDDLKMAKEQLANVDTYKEHLPMEDQAKCSAMEARLTAQIELLEAALEIYHETGTWPGIGADGALGDLLQELPDLPAGWHGEGITYMNKGNGEYSKYEDAVYMSREGGELAGVIQVPSASEDAKMNSLQGPAIGLVLTDEYLDELKAGRKGLMKTVGADIWVTFGNKTWILKGAATRPDVMIYMSAQQCKKQVIIDASGVIRVAGDSGRKFLNPDMGLVLIGGKGDDILIGSQADDLLIGGEGSDRLFGMNGIDKIFGDTVRRESPEAPLRSVNDATGGDDFIDGGNARDIIFAGGGANDTVVTDANEPGGMDEMREWESSVDFKNMVNRGDLNDMKLGLDLDGWKSNVEPGSGEVVISRGSNFEASENSIEINPPEGYMMAYGKEDGYDTVITYTKMDENSEGEPEPQYIRVRIKGVLAKGNHSTVVINKPDSGNEGVIYDLSKLFSAGNTFILNGTNQNDVLLGPITNLDRLRIKAEDLQNGCTFRKAEMEAMLPKDEATGAVSWGGDIWITEPQVTNDEVILSPRPHTDSIDLITPNNFGSVDGVFYELNGSDIVVYVVHITDKDSGEFEMLQLRIRDGARDGKVPLISVGGTIAEAAGTTEFNSEGGSDLVVGNIGSTTDWGEESRDDTVLRVWQAEPSDEEGDEFDTSIDSDGDGCPDYIEAPFGTENDASKVPDIWSDRSSTDPDSGDDDPGEPREPV